jgi:hypothetical protein
MVREGLQMFDFPGGGAPTGQTGPHNPLKKPTTHPRMQPPQRPQRPPPPPPPPPL